MYALTNKRNNKVYIGQHRGYTLSKRWNRKLDNAKVNAHLTAAIKKYGATSFTRKILCFASCQQELDLLEQFWISVYKATDPRFGYNQQSGGRNWRGSYTPRLKQLISKAARKAWAKKSAKERWEFAFAAKLRWLMRTERERERMMAQAHKVPWNKGLKGIPSGRKGKKYGPHKNPCCSRKPFTKQHKERISKGLKRYYRQRAKG